LYVPIYPATQERVSGSADTTPNEVLLFRTQNIATAGDYLRFAGAVADISGESSTKSDRNRKVETFIRDNERWLYPKRTISGEVTVGPAGGIPEFKSSAVKLAADYRILSEESDLLPWVGNAATFVGAALTIFGIATLVSIRFVPAGVGNSGNKDSKP
jgi:hypothetical protein